MAKVKADTHGQTINAIPPGGAASLEKIDFGGALEARRMPSGAVWLYWRYTADGRTERVKIGPYDSAASPKALSATPRGFSVAAARVAARELAQQNAELPGGLRAERERQAAAKVAADSAKATRAKYTLKALCADYCGLLHSAGKSSWRDAENIFSIHIEQAFPDLADKPAAEVEKREIVTAVRKLTEAGKSATARKLRAYLRAAYACAVRADSDAALPSSFIAYGVTSNPVDGIAAIRGKADKNPLTGEHLRTYWKALLEVPGVVGAALRLQVVTGGQRVAQLARLAHADVTGETLRLLDPKGKRSEAREHLLPITKAVRRELDQLAPEGFFLSTDGGKTPMHPTSISAWAHEIGAGAGIPGFQLKRVRSGIETMLAEAGVSRELRGQLQSHGLGGVQERHYDGHHYMPEKRRALEALHRLLEQEPSKNVAPLRKKRA